jgi:hypothetical protein
MRFLFKPEIQVFSLKLLVLCIEIMSRNARYYARSKYQVSGLSAGIYRIEIPTKIPDKLKRYMADETLCTFEIDDLNLLCETSLRRRDFGDWLRPVNLKIFCAE